MKRLAAIIIALVVAGPAWAQQPVVTMPLTTTVSQGSGSILATNTFQQIFPASTTQQGRVGCVVQNVGTNSMFVFFGVITGATTPKSVRLPSNATVNCHQGGLTIRDAVNITGTAGEQFFAVGQ
jgi:hypothetical protein